MAANQIDAEPGYSIADLEAMMAQLEQMNTANKPMTGIGDPNRYAPPVPSDGLGYGNLGLGGGGGAGYQPASPAPSNNTMLNYGIDMDSIGDRQPGPSFSPAFDPQGGFGVPDGKMPPAELTPEQLQAEYDKMVGARPVPTAGSSATLDAMREIPGPPGQIDTSGQPQPQLKPKGIGGYFRDMIGQPGSIMDGLGSPLSPKQNMPGIGVPPTRWAGQPGMWDVDPPVEGASPDVNLPPNYDPYGMDMAPPDQFNHRTKDLLGYPMMDQNVSLPTVGLPPLTDEQLKEIQDGNATITPRQPFNLPAAAPPDPKPSYDPTTPAYVEPVVEPDTGGAVEKPQTAPSTSTRSGGGSGNPASLATDAVDAERKLNVVQRFMKNKLGMEDPEERHRLGLALIKGGSAMATTPGDFSQGLSAGTSAGADAYVGEEQRAFENGQKKELMDLRREEAAAQRAGDVLEAEKKRLEIKKLKQEAERDDGKDSGHIWRILSELKTKPAQRAFLKSSGFTDEQIDFYVDRAAEKEADPLAGLTDDA